MSKPPKVVIPGLNRGAGIPAGYMVGRRKGKGKGPAELLDLSGVKEMGVATSAQVVQTAAALSTAVSTAIQSISPDIMMGEGGEDGQPGPPGLPGAAGAAGATGATGATGAPGAAGVAGSAGPPGFDGQDGEDGLPAPEFSNPIQRNILALGSGSPTTPTQIQPDKGPLIIGANSSAETFSGTIPVFQITSIDTDSLLASLSSFHWAATAATSFQLIFARSRGASVLARGVVLDGDRLGQFAFYGDDGTNFQAGALIRAAVQGAPATGSVPGLISIFTRPVGGALTERLRVDNVGNLLLFGPGLSIAETAAASVPTPAANRQAIFIDTDHVAKLKNSAGVTSLIGLTGPVGPQGPIGFGMDGDIGEEAMRIPGVPGPQGSQGSVGPQGPIGFGMDGADGEEAIRVPGVPGPQGSQGSVGPQGSIGFGLDGVDGEEGMAIPGVPGPAGPTGATGATGLPPYIAIPKYRGNSGQVFTFGNCGGHCITIPADCTIKNIIVFVATANGSAQVAPAIYSIDGAGNMNALLAQGPLVTGMAFGINILPLTTPLAVTKGQILWICVQVLVSSLTIAATETISGAFFAAAGALPSTAAVGPYGSLGIAVWPEVA